MNDAGAAPAASPAPAALSRTMTIRNQRGLHARAAARFVKCAELFTAEITVRKKDMSVSGLSIMGLMMLAAGPGTTIEIMAQGDDAEVALKALGDLVEGKFGEE